MLVDGEVVVPDVLIVAVFSSSRRTIVLLKSSSCAVGTGHVRSG